MPRPRTRCPTRSTCEARRLLPRGRPTKRDPKRFRVFLVVSRQVVIESKCSTVVCAPVYTARHGLSTQVPVGPDEGLRHESSVHCDEPVSLPKSMLTHLVGTLPPTKRADLDRALITALEIDLTSAARD